MSLKKFVRRTSPVALSVLIAACGGGSVGNSNQGSEPETGAANGETEGAASTVSGRVADGYIKGALVCVDLNENDSCDADEPSTVTGDGGTYDLDIPAGAQAKPIVADIPAEAIDEDTGEAVGQPLVFIAPADKPEFLSPITTLVHQELRANPALNTEDAEQAVKSILGIDEEDVSLFSDYVAGGEDTSGNSENAEKFRYLHDTARVVASMMKDIETQVETAAVLKGIDVEGDLDTQRAIREIVRSEVRDLLPQIAQQVAEIVRTDNTGDTSGEGSAEAATEFDPDLLAQNLRPVDAGENVEDRIDAVRERVDAVDSDIRQLLTDGVYWMEFDCNYENEREELKPIDGQTAFNENELGESTGEQTVSNIDFPMPECEAQYGHVQLDDSGDTLVSENYQYENETGGWVVDVDEDDSHTSNFSLVEGQWISVDSAGPEGQVEFTEDGAAIITNAEGRMQLKAVTQEVGGSLVIKHFWEDAANPMWIDLVESTDIFPAGSLAHKISVRQSSHPYTLFNHYPHDEQAQEYCAQYNDNCNVVNAFLDGQQHVVTTLDEIRDAAFRGTELVAQSAGFGQDSLMKLSSELPADGTMPVNGLVHWTKIFDNHYNESGVDGVDPYGTYPEGNKDVVECHEETNPAGEFHPDELQNALPGDTPVTGTTYPTGSDGTDEAGQTPEGPDSLDTGIREVPESFEEHDCTDLSAQTGIDPDTTDYPDRQSTDAVDYPQPVDQNDSVLVSEWRLIEAQGVSMIEIQIPFMLRHEVDTGNGAAILLIEHQGFVRMGARLPESYIDRVITYNETAFTTLRSIVETGIDNRQ